MRRFVRYLRVAYPLTGAANTNYRLRTTLQRSQIYPGFDSNGIQGATAPILGTSKRFNWLNWHPTTFFSLCFVGSRGSYIYSANVCGRQNVSHSRIYRNQATHGSNAWRSNTVTDATVYLNEASVATTTLSASGATGQVMTNQATQAGATALVPMYNRYKFVSNNIVDRIYGSALDDTNLDAIVFEAELATSEATDIGVTHTDIYLGAGTDFNLVFFLNVPALWILDAVPTAVDRP
jgi:hypothetical protein